MLRGNISWGRNETDCWCDAETASAVLSLLQKEPLTVPGEDKGRQQRLTCISCFEDLESTAYPQFPITALCEHGSMPDVRICTDCLQQSLDIQFASAGPDALLCPLCHRHLVDEEVRRWASRRTVEMYDALRTWKGLEMEGGFGGYLRREYGFGGRDFTCAACRMRCSQRRDTVWYHGLDCAEFEEVMGFGWECGCNERRRYPP